MTGYANYQDPRLQPPEEPERERCGDCAYYKDVPHTQQASGLRHFSGACVYDVFKANTFKQLAKADLVEVDPTDEPCRDYKEDK